MLAANAIATTTMTMKRFALAGFALETALAEPGVTFFGILVSTASSRDALELQSADFALAPPLTEPGITAFEATGSSRTALEL